MNRRAVHMGIDSAGTVSIEVKEGPPPDEDIGLPLKIVAEAYGTSSHLEVEAHMLVALRSKGYTFLKQTHPPWYSVDLELLRRQITDISDITWLKGKVPARFGEEYSPPQIHLHTTLYPRHHGVI